MTHPNYIDVNFDCSLEDKKLIGKILSRGMAMGKQYNVEFDHVTLAMDITAVHCNGHPLSLLQWLMSSDVDFSQDWLCINRHIDRNTGKLHGYQPLFAKK